MVQDVYSASWDILEALNKHGSNVANQILLHTKIGSRTTLYKALELLLKEKLIIVDKNKTYSINGSDYLSQVNILKIYEQYEEQADNLNKILEKLTKRFENHKPILIPGSKQDYDIARDVLTKPPYDDLIIVISRLFEVGALMEFFINSGAISKTIEIRATSLRRRNEKIVSKFMNIIKKAEPVLWGETLMMIQTRLSSKISPA